MVDPTTGPGASTLGRIDTQTLRVSRIAPIVGWPELTGTGDANLWGFFPDPAMPQVARIDKVGAGLDRKFPLPALAGNPSAWAFAFWGGDFWIFLQRDTDASTTVWHLKQSDGSVKAAVPNTGRKIVGAGVSTCAPIAPIG
jgi:hypothetical protein